MNETPGSLSVDYLSEALGRPGELRSVEVEQIGAGQMGSNFVVGLTWNQRGTGPSSLVAKLPSGDDETRQFALDHYLREIEFYDLLAPRLAIRTPQTYHLDHDRCLLLMEDLSGLRPGNQRQACSDTEAALAVSSLGGLHGPTWNDRSLLELARFQRSGDEWARSRQTVYRSSWPEFVDRYRPRLTSTAIDVGQWLDEHLVGLLTAERSAFCLIHNDYRTDNLLFGDEPGGDEQGGDEQGGDEPSSSPPLVAVDWQTAAVGSGPADVAYFIGGSLATDHRRANESSLWASYLGGLSHHLDPALFDPDDLWRDYRLSSFFGVVTAVIAALVAERTDRGDELFALMANRHTQHLVDLDLPGLVSDELG